MINQTSDFGTWFHIWNKERLQYPCCLEIVLDEPIQEDTTVSVTIHPVRDQQDPAACHKPPRFKYGHEVPICLFKETLNRHTAFQLETALITIRKSQGLNFKEGLAYMTFLMLAFTDHGRAQNGRPSFLFGPIYDESISPIARKAIQPMMRRFVFAHFEGLLDFWNLMGVRFARGIFQIPMKPGRISYMTIPHHWLSLQDLQLRGEEPTAPPNIPLIIDTRIFSQVKKVADSLRDAIDALHLDGTISEKIVEKLQMNRYTFRLSGDYWFIRYHGDTITLKNSKGLQLIALLLKNPGVGFPVIDLAREFENVSDRISDEHFEEGHISKINGLRDAGPVADKQAIKEYRERIKEIDQEIEEVKMNKDIGHIEHLETERESVLKAIRAACGLGKSGRKALSISESARATITMAIKSAIKKIGQHDPDLSTYLQQTIETGSICKYSSSPAKQVRWIF